MPAWLEVIPSRMRVLVHSLPERSVIDTQVQEQLMKIIPVGTSGGGPPWTAGGPPGAGGMDKSNTDRTHSDSGVEIDAIQLQLYDSFLTSVIGMQQGE